MVDGRRQWKKKILFIFLLDKITEIGNNWNETVNSSFQHLVLLGSHLAFYVSVPTKIWEINKLVS